MTRYTAHRISVASGMTGIGLCVALFIPSVANAVSSISLASLLLALSPWIFGLGVGFMEMVEDRSKSFIRRLGGMMLIGFVGKSLLVHAFLGAAWAWAWISPGFVSGHELIPQKTILAHELRAGDRLTGTEKSTLPLVLRGASPQEVTRWTQDVQSRLSSQEVAVLNLHLPACGVSVKVPAVVRVSDVSAWAGLIPPDLRSNSDCQAIVKLGGGL